MEQTTTTTLHEDLWTGWDPADLAERPTAELPADPFGATPTLTRTLPLVTRAEWSEACRAGAASDGILGTVRSLHLGSDVATEGPWTIRHIERWWLYLVGDAPFGVELHRTWWTAHSMRLEIHARSRKSDRAALVNARAQARRKGYTNA